MKNYKIIYRDLNNLFIFQVGRTSNAKISDGKNQIMQTYTFSIDQFNLVQSGKYDFKSFFALDKANCLDCPFSGNMGQIAGKCYTHKPIQYFGFISMLKSIKEDINSIPYLNEEIKEEIINSCGGKYVRFGTYGEPSLIDYNLVSDICKVSRTWTGYTHQWAKQFGQKYASFFMSSVHSISESIISERLNFRSFIVSSSQELNKSNVICPASKEANYKTTCEKCSLCSGKTGKGQKSVTINYH